MLLSNGTLTLPASSDLYSSELPWQERRELYPSAGLGLVNAFASYGAVYRTQVWIAAPVNKLALGLARLPLKNYLRDDADARVQARDTPYARLLRNPNSRHDRFFFWMWTASTFEIYGESMWIKLRDARGVPQELWPMHPSKLGGPRLSTTESYAGQLVYYFRARPHLEWPLADVVHFKSYNPDNLDRGLSRLEPLRQTIISEDAIRRSQASFWTNGAKPSVILTHPAEFRGPAADRIAASWKAAHSGVDAWSKTAVLEEGMKAETFQLDAEAMQMIESRKVNREEACGIYDVPPPVLQILDRATFSNITEQMRSMYRDTQAPRLGLYESVLDAQLRPDFDPSGAEYAEFLLEEVLRGAFEQRAAANQSAIFSGQRTPNEVRKQDNLPPLEGGDRLYINAGAIPLDAAEETQEPAITPSPQRPGSPTKAVVVECDGCGNAGHLSARGLCRSCEGKASRQLTAPKELTT